MCFICLSNAQLLQQLDKLNIVLYDRLCNDKGVLIAKVTIMLLLETPYSICTKYIFICERIRLNWLERSVDCKGNKHGLVRNSICTNDIIICECKRHN
jgi:hypothetical protein